MRNFTKVIFLALILLVPLTGAVAEDLYEMEDLDDHGPRAGYIAQNEDKTLELLAHELPALESFEVYVMDYNWQDVSLEGLTMSANVLDKMGSDEPATEYTCSATEENFTCKTEEGKELVTGNVLSLKLQAEGKEIPFLYTYPFKNKPVQ